MAVRRLAPALAIIIIQKLGAFFSARLLEWRAASREEKALVMEAVLTRLLRVINCKLDHLHRRSGEEF